MSSKQPWSLTAYLLGRFPEEYEMATRAPFLEAAAKGSVSKGDVGRWLASDRLYIHAYFRAVGHTLAYLDLPKHVPMTEVPETQFVDWLIDTLQALRREERTFIDVAGRYGLGFDLLPTIAPRAGVNDETTASDGLVEPLLPGLSMMEKVFRSIEPPDLDARGHSPATPCALPWLEAAVIFWGTEKCYLDAWSWAKSRQVPTHPDDPKKDRLHEDADGGAVRNELISNWSSSEFTQVVDRLARLIDSAVADALAIGGDGLEADIVGRIEGKWKSLLAAEAAFWPPLG